MLLTIGMTLWSLFTLVTPIAAQSSHFLLLGARCLMGVGEGTAFPAVHAMISKYAKPHQRSSMVAIATSGSYVGSVIALLLCPLIISAYGWPTIFYSFGLAGLVFIAVVWGPYVIVWRFVVVFNTITAHLLFVFYSSSTHHLLIYSSSTLLGFYIVNNSQPSLGNFIQKEMDTQVVGRQ